MVAPGQQLYICVVVIGAPGNSGVLIACFYFVLSHIIIYTHM